MVSSGPMPGGMRTAAAGAAGAGPAAGRHAGRLHTVMVSQTAARASTAMVSGQVPCQPSPAAPMASPT